MTASRPHQIRHARLALNFDSAPVAEAFEQQAHQWVMQRLLPHIEHLFDQLCPPGEVITIDQLLLDTGTIPADTMYEALLAAIETQLIDQLRPHLQPAGRQQPHVQHSGPEQEKLNGFTEVTGLKGLTRRTSAEDAWAQARCFLETGQLHWSADLQDPTTMDHLVRTWQQHPAQLTQLLTHSAESTQLLNRLLEQTPEESLADLLATLPPAIQHRAMQRLTRHPKRHHPRLQNALNQFWQNRLTEAFSHHQLNGILPDWDLLTQAYQTPLLTALRRHAQDSALPFVLISALRETHRLSLLACLEPAEYPFLCRILKAPSLWQNSMPSAAEKTETDNITRLSSQNITHLSSQRAERRLSLQNRHLHHRGERGERCLSSQNLSRLSLQNQSTQNKALSPDLFSEKTLPSSPRPQPTQVSRPVPHLSQQLWCFTLHYLLTERGSQFNRRQFLMMLIVRMAAANNQKPADLLSGLQDGLNTQTSDTTLQAQMRQLLTTIARQWAKPETLQPQPGLNPPKSGSSAWQQPAPQAMSVSWLEAAAQVAGQSAQTASQSGVTPVKIPVNTVSALTPAEKVNQTPADDIHALLEALKYGSEATLKRLWPDHPDILTALLRQAGQLAAVRQHWAEHFTDPTLLDFSGLIAPDARGFIRHVIENRRIFMAFVPAKIVAPVPAKSGNASEVSVPIKASVPIKSTKASEVPVPTKASVPDTSSTTSTVMTGETLRISLWQFTLGYLLTERGSEFNRRSYLQSLVRQMAARRNISQSALIQAMIAVLTGEPPHELLTLLLSLQHNPPSQMTAPASEAATDALMKIAGWWQHPSDMPELAGDTGPRMHIRQLIQVLLHPAPDQWRTLPAALLDTHQTQIQSLLHQLGSSAAVRQQWAERFDLPSRLALVTLIDPAAAPVLTTLVHAIPALSRKLAVTPPLQEQPLQTSLWTISLTYLLVERGSEFNRRSYLSSLMTQLAARHNLDLRQLIETLRSLDPAPVRFQDDLTWMLSQLDPAGGLTASQWLNQLNGHPQHIMLTESQQRHFRRFLCHLNPTDAAHYAIGQFAPDAQQQLITTLAPSVWQDVGPLLPVLTVLFQVSTLPAYLFYRLLFSAGTPKTIADWSHVLLRELQKINTAQSMAEISEHLQQQLKQAFSKNTFSRTQQSAWLSALQEPVRLTQWLNSDTRSRPEAISATIPEQLTHSAARSLIAHQHASLWRQLTQVLQSRQQCNHWITRLDDASHMALFATQYPQRQPYLITLYHTLMLLTGGAMPVRQAFWQIIYHRWLITDVQGPLNALFSQLLAELMADVRIQSCLNLQPQKDRRSQEETNEDRHHLLIRQLAQQLPVEAAWLKALADQFKACDAQTQPDKAVNEAQTRKEKETESVETERTDTLGDLAGTGTPAPAALTKHLTGTDAHLTGTDAPLQAEHPASDPVLWQAQDAQDENEATGEPIQIINAGLVLASTYIPMLLQRLELTDGQQFISPQTRQQAVFCLQWLTHGTDEAPEYLLPLNKVLCGMPLHEPVPFKTPLPQGAIALTEGLLQAIIDHWKALGATSVAGLQTTFLQRGGNLTETEKQWQLAVFPGPFDMLLDQLPWTFQTIKYPWMDKPLFVSWR
ncbi:hypothetical protein VA7868_01486 [Vibrio aerogenes CECT 7868]|uniref:Uncharacterized protein n=1 Tax=Vibrio aerogenes CECT 7868 TaxID=1216006 RepID=A0A1M5Y535_9VIBR|nr:contractile injection system tape measure protein [Vibrio aerogenes]SHI06914.1 hypothetical protein VA7868_01486 [Vibrio aerogenes CECT 7868]